MLHGAMSHKLEYFPFVSYFIFSLFSDINIDLNKWNMTIRILFSTMVMTVDSRSGGCKIEYHRRFIFDLFMSN